MNYENVKFYSYSEYKRAVLKTTSKLEDKDHIINYFKKHIRSNYYINNRVIIMSNLVTSYKDNNGNIITTSIFDSIPDFKPNELYSDKDNFSTKITALSILLSYYFNIGNYKKFGEVFEKSTFLTNDHPYFASTYTSEHKNANFDARLLTCVLFYSLKNKKIKSDISCYLKNYMSFMAYIAQDSKLDEFMSDKTISMMYQRIIHDYFEGKNLHGRSPLIGSSRYSAFSILDNMETNTPFLEEFLSNFSENAWFGITRRSDREISEYLDELDNNKERLIKIFNNYLYSRYALGQRYKHLETLIKRMVRMIEVLEYDEYGVLDIVAGLPDKIQNAALKTMIGD